MYQLDINGMLPEQFLEAYWQQKPLLIKNGFKDFQDPLDADELAGLAMEEGVESRIVTNKNDNWETFHGPFEDFAALGETESTLLVQAVDHWHPEAAQLLAPFRFIPNWRIDDLMVSFSTPGGGVGPHLDQYDVFIIQGQGKRRWRVGLPNPALKQFARNSSLLQVEQFDAVIDAELEPGDILYIPPGCPHEGYAIENALNYSVGFRAPNQTDLISNFADYLIDHELGRSRYSDPKLSLRASRGEITARERDNIRELMQGVLNDDELFSRWAGDYLSAPKHEMDTLPADPPYNEAQVEALLESDEYLYKVGGLRAVYQVVDDILVFSCYGASFDLPLCDLENVKKLTDLDSTTGNSLKSSKSSLLFVQCLTTLLNEGLWFTE